MREETKNIEQREIVVTFVPQPKLTDIYDPTNPATDEPRTNQTLRFWDTLSEFPPLTTQGLQETQWLDLARTMILDDAYNRGDTKLGPERRLQLAQYGITPDSLARHRITMATADEAEDKRRASRAAADVRGRYRSLKGWTNPIPFKPRDPGEFPSLGWECLAWIEENLAEPDCAEYQPLVLTPEQARFILRYYKLDPETGQRVYTRGILSRPKGWGKSPIMGAIGALEALGPVCFGGWDASGQPVGVPWSEFTTPKVQFAAVNEDQSKNAYGPLLEMLRDGPVMRNYDIDPMVTFVALPKGRIEFNTAGALSKEGGRPVWFSADQTEAWTQSNGGVKLAAVLRRNTGKLGGHSIETPNAYRPGSGSVAEETFKALELQQQGRLKRETILVDHREAPEDMDLADHDSLYRGLVHAYGDSAKDNGGWVDIERIITEIWDPSTDPSDARQFYLNQIVSSSDSFLSHLEVDAIEDRDKAIRPGDKVVLGFDGSRGRVRGNADATALIGMRVTDGHLFEVAVWQSKNPRDPDWEPDTRQVDAVVRDCFSRYRVVGMYCDPSGWTEHVSAWEAEFAPKLKVKA